MSFGPPAPNISCLLLCSYIHFVGFHIHNHKRVNFLNWNTLCLHWSFLFEPSGESRLVALLSVDELVGIDALRSVDGGRFVCVCYSVNVDVRTKLWLSLKDVWQKVWSCVFLYPEYSTHICFRVNMLQNLQQNQYLQECMECFVWFICRAENLSAELTHLYWAVSW